jgi:2-methylcitrate dehydratase PrpD
MSVAPDMESVAPGATKALSSFAADLRYDEIDAVALHKARSHTLDTIGVCLAGGQEDVAQIAGAVIEDVMAEGDVPVPGRIRRADMLSAAFLAGTACHGLELDDGFRAGGMHPGCVVIPAALAVGYRAGVDGKRFLTAIVAGYEVAARIAALVHPRPRWRGFHNTATIGVFAAAATTGVLKGFDADTTENAFGIAASSSSGIRSYTRGGDVKRIHPGLAARDGILAALLAEKGLRGAPDVLESPDGFLFAFAGEEGMEAAKGMDVFAAGGHLNSRFAIADCYIKPHACCRHLHPGIDALLAITGREEIAPESVTGIEVDTYRVAATHGEIGWSSMTAAQMSFPFALGAALEYGAVDLARYSEQGRDDARVLGHCDKVTVRPDDALDAVYPERRPARVILHTADGRRFEERVDEPLGSAGNAVPDDMLEDKFRRLAGPVIGAERTDALVAQLWTIDGLASVAPLTESLAVDKG